MAASDHEWAKFIGLLERKKHKHAWDVCTLGRLEFAQEPRWVLGLSWVKLGLGELDHALRLSKLASELAPQEPAVFRTTASILLDLKKPDEAFEAASYAFQLAPDKISRRLMRRAQRARELKDQGRFARWRRPTQTSKVTQIAKVPKKSSLPLFRDQSGVTLLHERLKQPERRILEPLIEKQLHAMFGESLFGSWEMRVDVSPVAGVGRERKPTVTLWRIVSIGLVVAMLGGSSLVVHLWMKRSQNMNLVKLTAEAKTFLRTGAYRSLHDLEGELTENMATREVQDTYADLRARIDATLFRFYDADPGRLKYAQAYLRSQRGIKTDVFKIVRALVSPSIARVPMITALAHINLGPHDSTTDYLLATAELHRGNTNKAVSYLQRVVKIEPSHLPFLAEVHRLLRTKRPAYVAKLTELMLNVDPMSPWTKLVRARNASVGSARIKAFKRMLKKSDLGEFPNVLLAEIHFEIGLEQLALGELKQGLRQIHTALTFVDGNRVFLLDYFYRLVDLKHIAAAQRLAVLPSFPVTTPLGARAIKRLGAMK